MAIRRWTGAAGDSKFDTAGNYAENAAPANGDDVYFRARALVDGTAGDKDCTDGLDQSAVRLASLHIEQSFMGLIGTATSPLKIGAAQVEIGEHYGFGSPAGSQRVHLDCPHFDAQVGPVITVHNSASASAEEYLPPVRVLAHDSDAQLYVRRGSVGVGALGEAGTFSAIHESWVDSLESDADLVVGPGVTVTTIDKTGGEMTLQVGATTVTNFGGTLVIVGSGAITTLNVEGGLVVPNSGGTITTLNADGGTTDLTRSRAARTVTTPKIKAGATVKCDPDVVTFTNKLQAVGPVALSAQAA